MEYMQTYNREKDKEKDILGLTEQEVKERVLRGEINKSPKAPSKTFLQIL